MNENIRHLGIAIIASLFLITVEILLLSAFSLMECNSKWSSFDNRWGFMSDCQIKINDKWIPADSYYLKEDLKK